MPIVDATKIISNRDESELFEKSEEQQNKMRRNADAQLLAEAIVKVLVAKGAVTVESGEKFEDLFEKE